MPVGDPGKEQFRRAMVKDLRNLFIPAGCYPLIIFRQEIVANDEFKNRGGVDNPTRDHYTKLLVNCDRWRRRVTHNPPNKKLEDLIDEAVDVGTDITEGQNPFGGDLIQAQSGGLFDFPWALDGSDPDLPVSSQLSFQNGNAMLMLNAVDRAIVNWTRMNSRDRTRFITPSDSLRMFGQYQTILGFINAFMGDANRVDVVQVLPSQEPLGPTDSPNMRGETANPQPASGGGSGS